MIARLRQYWKSARFRIVFWATFTGLMLGVSGLSVPIEDVLRNLRVPLRLHPSNGQTVMVLMDDRTLGALDSLDVSRGDDAKLLDTLFGAGAKRVFFARLLPDQARPEDRDAFIAQLKAHPGRVFTGALPSSDQKPGNYAARVPTSAYAQHIEVVSLLTLHHPFNIGFEMPFASDSPIGQIPSMSAALAGVEGDTSTLFTPDTSIDVRSYPEISYIDVLRGDFIRENVTGKDVIVVAAAANYNDIHKIAGQYGTVPGGYIQALAGETLQQGLPRNVGWLLPLVIVVAIIVTGIGRGRVLDWKRSGALLTVIVAAPFMLEYVRVSMQVAPAFVVALTAVLRMRSLDRVEVASETNAGSGLPSVQALRNSAEKSNRILVALKIRNYGAIIGSFAEHVEANVAREIVRRIRISDDTATVYHEGGMFMWLSSIRNAFDLFENLEGLHRIVQNGIQVGGLDIDLSFNCGVDSEFDRAMSTRVAGAMQSAEEAIRNDELVYQHDSRKHEAQWEISLLTSLDRAIDNGEVWVAYQPKFDLRSNRICGAEALVRWTHPERGPISPEKFIRIAEEFHRIERITRFVVDDAVRCAVEMMREGLDISMSVNISAQLLRNPVLPTMISDILALHGLPADRLILEITETDKLDRSSRTYQMLQRLVQSGLRLSIDDFGTGNATLDYLRYLPASEVKIDRSFVSAMETSKDDLVLVQSIIEMAHSLDRTVVAEGVETSVGLDILKRQGCDIVQGYHIGRPVPFADLALMIAAGQLKLHG
ncbi:EAL domain-containing protein [Novosphingobium mangrovi (ex Hu et al. 2023)]|uniref:EAL domain-containing protein n=1 Tax=Novosphingobium mangrovi (ex Hu et al. 2023) TaxID=2930094 RepID=A0ABT0A932_9SPHN|nr:EAL domain-containing protein [Novosphingobium mangrovi (ex Hu et al. 2023)]MCJ1959716.1 EAL domain-containing protein [Novosphingobium mangrovi (ex Hu et al. 2023)]